MSHLGYGSAQNARKVTTRQMWTIRMLMDQNGIPKTEHFQWLLKQTDRNIGSPQELTLREASRIIEKLKEEGTPSE